MLPSPKFGYSPRPLIWVEPHESGVSTPGVSNRQELAPPPRGSTSPQYGSRTGVFLKVLRMISDDVIGASNKYYVVSGNWLGWWRQDSAGGEAICEIDRRHDKGDPVDEDLWPHVGCCVKFKEV